MSEVVPLPSFGEVFFDARGQDRVLRVTWHEGTLVLSLWRGEMCTASFRMPLEDVGRLLDTLDDGYAEAGGDELVQSGQHAMYPAQEAAAGYQAQEGAAGYLAQEGGGYQAPAADYQGDGGYTGDGYPSGEYPQTGHYARPPQSDYPAEYAGGDYQSADGYQDGDYQGGYQGGRYAEPEAPLQPPQAGAYDDRPQPGAYDDRAQAGGYDDRPVGHGQERPPAPLGPNDVLVARGTPPAADKLVAGHAQGADAVPRENLIVGDSLQYGRPDHHGTDPSYPMPEEPYSGRQGGRQGSRSGGRGRSQNGGPATDPYGFAADDVDRYGRGGDYDSYGDDDQARTYGRQVPHPDPYGTPSHPDDPPGYGGDQGYGEAGRGAVDPADPLGLGQGGIYVTGERIRPDQRRDDRDSRSDW